MKRRAILLALSAVFLVVGLRPLAADPEGRDLVARMDTRAPTAAEARERFENFYPAVSAPEVRVRLIASGLLGVNFAVAIEKTNVGYRVLYVPTYFPDTKQGSELTPAHSCLAGMDGSRAERIVSVWTKLLELGQPRSDDKGGLQMMAYFFTASNNSGELYGFANIPGDGSNTNRLVEIAKTLTRYCRYAPVNWWIGRRLDRQTDELLARLDTPTPKSPGLKN